MRFKIKWTNPETGTVSYTKAFNSEWEAYKWCGRMNHQWPERNHVVVKDAEAGRDK